MIPQEGTLNPVQQNCTARPKALAIQGTAVVYSLQCLGYRLDGLRTDLQEEQETFASQKCPDQTCSLIFIGYEGGGGVFARVKRTQHEVDHYPLSTAQVKNEWGYNSAPSVDLHDAERDNFILTFLCIM